MQVVLTAMVHPVSDTVHEPAVAVGVPPQLLVNPLGVATTSPAGKLSVNATPASATPLAAGLVSVMVRMLTPFAGMPMGLNALAMEGGETTDSEAEAVPPVPPSVEVTLPVVLFLVPEVVPVTFTAKGQEVLCARIAHEILIPLMAFLRHMIPP